MSAGTNGVRQVLTRLRRADESRLACFRVNLQELYIYEI